MMNNLHSIKYLLVLVGTLLLMAACRHDRVHEQLLAADAVMESQPDSALAILSRIDRPSPSSPNLPLYALLLTQAEIRCGYIPESDSLINIAFNEYISSNEDNKLKRASFYRGWIEFRQGNMQGAIKDATRTYDMATETNDCLWIARSAELIADIFSAAYNFAQSEKYTLQAVENYKRAGKIRNHRYALCDLATDYGNQGDFDQSLRIFDSITALIETEQPIDSALLQYATEAVLKPLYYSGNNSELKQALTFLENGSFSAERNLTTALTNIDYYSLYNDTEKCSYYIQLAAGLSSSNRDSIKVMYSRYFDALRSERYREAAEMADSLITLQNTIVGEVLSQSVAVAQSDFYLTKVQQSRKRAKQLHLIIVVSIITSLVLLTFTIIVYRWKFAAKGAELELTILSLASEQAQKLKISEANKSLSNTLDKRNEDVHTLFRNQWQTLSMLCNQYFDLGDSANTRVSILNNIESELKKFRNRKNIQSIATALDRYYDGIMTKLRQDFPSLKEEDFVFLSLVFAGFSVRAICMFTDIKYKNFYQKKARLIKRIADSDAPHKAEILRLIK